MCPGDSRHAPLDMLTDADSNCRPVHPSGHTGRSIGGTTLAAALSHRPHTIA